MGNTIDFPQSGDVEQATMYHNMCHEPRNSEVLESYEELIRCLRYQFTAIHDQGITVELSNTNPYRTSKEMFAAVDETGVLRVARTGMEGEHFPDMHMMLNMAGLSDGRGEPMLVNDMFRAVHDYVGHYLPGNSFSPDGECCAFLCTRKHSRRLPTWPCGVKPADKTPGQTFMVGII